MTEGSEDVDLVVIGLGPGGEALATGAAQAGLTVVAVDKHLVGGECPYYGCVPTKTMVRASEVLGEARRIEGTAGEVAVTPSWTPVAAKIADQVTDHWDDRVAVERLEGHGATVLHGHGRLTGVGEVAVTLPDGATRSFTASRGVALDPGTRPAIPPVDGLEGTPYWTNRDVVKTDAVPGSLVVLGGGPIGCELAQVFARFGSRVTVVQHDDRLLGNDEPEAADLLAAVFAEEGMRVLTGVEATRVEHADGTFTVHLDTDETVTADRLLVAAGRRPNHDDIGLDAVGLDPDARHVEVDERMRAGERLWVIGDVAGHGAFTHLSMYQAAVALRDVLGEDGPPASYHAVPHVTFTDPEVGGVGLTEQQAHDAGLTVRVGSTPLEYSTRGFTHGAGARGLVKVVEDADRGVLVGATVVGPYGGEILGLLALAVHAEVPTATLRTMIYAYPTFHRAIESAIGDLS